MVAEVVIVRSVWFGGLVTTRMRVAAADGLFDAAEHILEYANRSVPHREGTLMRSGQADVDRARLEASVSYDTPYAVRLHEHPEYNFRGGRRGKWLELSLAERETAVRDVLIASVRRALP